MVVNVPPSGGQLTVNPIAGEELGTIFALRMLNWGDIDLPLAYGFGYLSNLEEQEETILVEKSTKTFYKTFLPRGFTAPGWDWQIPVIGVVYDSFNAFTTVRVNTTVKELQVCISTTTLLSLYCPVRLQLPFNCLPSTYVCPQLMFALN